MILNTKHGQNLGKPKIQLDIYYAAIRGKDYMDDNNLKKKTKINAQFGKVKIMCNHCYTTYVNMH